MKLGKAEGRIAYSFSVPLDEIGPAWEPPLDREGQLALAAQINAAVDAGELFGMRIVVDSGVPEDEIEYRSRGRVVGRIKL